MTVNELIGEGPELTIVQMSLRAIIVFMITLAFLRLGRRAFGIGSPFDLVIGILLGALLGRAVVGTSPFWATIIASCVIVLLHRILAWLSMHNRLVGKLIKGEAKPIYLDGHIVRKNMRQCLISENDLLEGIREAANVESLDEIKAAYIERDGKISVIKHRTR
jgi:uncharacterized membrane protein YcaP (DUF421 family)